MPQIKIKRGSYGGTPPHLDDGELALDTFTQRLYAGKQPDDGDTDKVRVKYADNADHADYASKIGTELSHPQIGSSVIPVYVDSTGEVKKSTGNAGSDEETGLTPIVLADGVLTGATHSLGSSTKPVYVEYGKIVPSDADVGSGTRPVYLSNGNISASTSNVGSYLRPVYMNGGVLTSVSSDNPLVSFSDDNKTATISYTSGSEAEGLYVILYKYTSQGSTVYMEALVYISHDSSFSYGEVPLRGHTPDGVIYRTLHFSRISGTISMQVFASNATQAITSSTFSVRKLYKVAGQ